MKQAHPWQSEEVESERGKMTGEQMTQKEAETERSEAEKELKTHRLKGALNIF